ncbi:beta-ketoacyl synthase chain length factor [Niveibacterium sp. 24ML]|nr:beta-ketoacyl synthase chain length factor [Niveibacterium sp. 24ML]
MRLVDWSAWSPGLDVRSAWRDWAETGVHAQGDDEPALPEVPAMIRRRADRLARMSLRVALDVLGERRNIPVVYVSRHGSVGRSAGLLEALALAQPLSPAAFAASVHNAASGVLGIVRGDPAPCSAVAAESDGIAAMLSEVHAFLSDDYPEVVAILCDEPLPPRYAQFRDADERPVAWAGSFSLVDGAGLALGRSGNAQSALDEPEILAWIRWLLSDRAALPCGAGWEVRRA